MSGLIRLDGMEGYRALLRRPDPVPHDPRLDSALDSVYAAVLDAAARCDDLETALALADWSVRTGFENPTLCDGCDRRLDANVMDAASYAWQHATDSNGDPDVSVCPACVAEARDYALEEGAFRD